MTNEFEYKIHISIDEKGLSSDVKSELAKVAKEISNNKIKLEFTGDYKDLFKQMQDLQKKYPEIDLTKGIEFHLSDKVKEDTEIGQRLMQEFANMVTNSLKDIITSINGIETAISNSEEKLKELEKRRSELHDGKEISDAVKAYENAEKRLSDAHAKFIKDGAQNKTRAKALEEMRRAVQDMKNLENETGKKVKNNATIKILSDTAKHEYEIAKDTKIKIGELQKELLNINPTHNSYFEMLGEIDAQIMEEKNKLSSLKKDLETANNPQLKVNGKLADNFLDDLQSQLNALTGLEVKVKPVVDKDTKLEVEGEIKPVDAHEEVSDALTSEKKFERLNRQVKDYQEAMANARLANPDIVKKREGRGLDNISELVPVYPEDVRQNSTTQTGLKRKLNEYLKQKKELETGVSEYGSKALSTEKTLSRALDELAAYTYSFKDANKAAEIFGKKNEDVFNLVQERIELAKKAAKGSEDSIPYMDGIKSMLEDYGIDKHNIGYSQKLQLGEAIETGGIEAFAAKVEELFGVKIPTSIDEAKASIQSISEAVSTPPNTSGMDKVEEELHEEASAATEAEQRLAIIRKAFNSMDTKQTTSNGLFDWIKNNCSEAEQSLFHTSEGVEEFKKVIRGLAFNSNNAISISESLGLDTINFNELSSKEKELASFIDSIEQLMGSEWFRKGEKTDLGQLYNKLFNDVKIGAKDAQTALSEFNAEKDRLNQTPVSSETPEKVSQLKREFEAREKNVSVINEQIEVEKALQNASVTSAILSPEEIATQAQKASDEATRAWIDGLEKIESESKDAGDKIKKALEVSKNADAGSSLELISNELEKINQEALNSAVKDSGFSKSFAKAADDIKRMNESMHNLGIDKFDSTIEELNVDLEQVGNSEKKLRVVRNRIDELKIATKQASDEARALADNQKNALSSLVSNINEKSTLELKNRNLEIDGKTDSSEYYNNQIRIEELEKEINAVDRLQFSEKQLKVIEEAKLKAKQELNKANATEKKAIDSTRLSIEKQVASLRENGKLMKVYGDRVNNLLKEAQGQNVTLEQLKKIRSELEQIATTAKLAGDSGQSFGQILKQRFTSLGAYLGSFASFYQVVGYVKQMINSVKELDASLTEMRKVSDESVETLKAFQKESFDIADSVGTTAKVIQDSTADWMRLGESLEEAKESAKDASILLNVSEFSSIDEATTALVAMSQAYSDMDKIDIIDKLNNIGNNFSISTDQLATGLQNAAAVLKTQGNDIDKSIALLTAANSIVQDISKASTGMRTIALRIAGTETAKKELEELGESVDDYIVQTTSKTQQTIKAYTAVASNGGRGVDVLDSNGNLRDTYDILLDISKVYKEIQEEDKKAGTNRAKALVEYIAGKNRSNIAASILESPELLEEVYEASQNSVGSAMEENEKYLDSIAGHIAKLKNQLEEFFFDTIDSEGVKAVTDLLTGFVKLVDQAGLLKTALIGIATVIGSKKLGYCNQRGSGIFPCYG